MQLPSIRTLQCATLNDTLIGGTVIHRVEYMNLGNLQSSRAAPLQPRASPGPRELRHGIDVDLPRLLCGCEDLLQPRA